MRNRFDTETLITMGLFVLAMALSGVIIYGAL